MKAFAIASVLLFAGTPTLADHIGLYSDASGSRCVGQLAIAPAINTVYIIHENCVAGGALASKWRIAHELSLVGVSFTLTNPYLAIAPIGDALTTGSSISYLECRQSPYVIGYGEFLYFGAPATGCDHLRVAAHQGDAFYPAEDTPISVDCTGKEHPAAGGSFSFNTTPGACENCSIPLPLQSTTWGAVKSMYR